MNPVPGLIQTHIRLQETRGETYRPRHKGIGEQVLLAAACRFQNSIESRNSNLQHIRICPELTGAAGMSIQGRKSTAERTTERSPMGTRSTGTPGVEPLWPARPQSTSRVWRKHQGPLPGRV